MQNKKAWMAGLMAQGGDFKITSAFTKVLTSAYTPNYGQLSCINPEFIVFLNGDDNTTANSQVALLNSAGVTQNTLEYYANTTGEAIRVKDCCADADATYFIGDNGNLDYYIWSTSHDGLTVNWGRKLRYAQTPQGYLNIAVAANYIYFFMGNSGGSANYLFGQLDKATGTLNWDKYFNLSNTYNTIKIHADENGVYLAMNNPNYGVFGVDSTGTKIWEKTFSSPLGNITGFAQSDTHLFVSGPDNVDATKLTVVKMLKSTGALVAQVSVTVSVPNASTVNVYPQNNSAYGGGKLIFGTRSTTGAPSYFPLMFFVSDENLNIETNSLVLSYTVGSGTSNTKIRSVVADNAGNWLVTGTRDNNGGDDHFISGVLEDGSFSTGWSTASRTVSTPSYTLGNGSTALADLTPSTNASETVTVSSPSNLATESW